MLKCRLCGAVLVEYTQEYIIRGVEIRPSVTSVTCPTHETKCPMGQQTINKDKYPTVDLDRWLHPEEWEAKQQALKDAQAGQ